jgi:hypothetical protein
MSKQNEKNETISYFKKSGRDVPPIHLLQVYGFSNEDAQKAADLEIELDRLKKMLLKLV